MPFIITVFGIGLILIISLRFIFNLYFNATATKDPPPLGRLFVSIIHLPIYWTILAICAIFGFLSLALNPITNALFLRLVVSFVLIIWSYSFLRHLNQILIRAFTPASRTHPRLTDTLPFVSGLAKLSFVFIVCYLLFLLWGVNLTPLVAVFSIIGAALSIAARDSISNVISGFSIFLSRSLKVGDYIVIDDKFEGIISETSLQTTKLIAGNKTEVNIPNTMIVTKPVVNHTAGHPYFRVEIPLTIPIKANYKFFSSKALSIAEGNKWVLRKPAPKLRLLSATPTELRLSLIVMIEQASVSGKVTHQILTQLLPTLKTLG